VANEHEIDLATQTLFAALLQRALDAEFDADFPEKGRFVRKRLKGRLYWYYQWRAGDKVMSNAARDRTVRPALRRRRAGDDPARRALRHPQADRRREQGRSPRRRRTSCRPTP
jgi:hypothetical protein